MPRYPVRSEVDAHPELLRLLPKRWQGNAAVVAALTACLALTNYSQASTRNAATHVAPVFQHGYGGGVFGCSAVNPPVFLSEDEARQVIVEEAKRAGINFIKDGKKLPKIEMPGNAVLARVTKPDKTAGYENRPEASSVKSIDLDGLDKKRNIAYEFVSEQDLKDWQTGITTMGTTGGEDLIGTAKAFAAGIAKAKPGGTYGVFYDPSVGWDDAEKTVVHGAHDPTAWKEENAKVIAAAGKIAREQLRAQVQDFIKWLKAQGVI